MSFFFSLRWHANSTPLPWFRHAGMAIFLGCTLSLLSTLPATAQTPSPSETADLSSTSGLETVNVTARKISENAQNVPISITAFNQSDLDRLDISTINDLTYATPSLDVETSTFRQDTLNVTIRGQRNFDSSSGGGNPGLSFDPATAVYVDGVYYARAVGLTGLLFDMDSLDVLKGPQGTLVGRNSTGGAILIQTAEPTDEFSDYLKLKGGDYNQYGLQAVINIPFSDNLFFRASLASTGNEGYIKNYFSDPVSGYTNTQPGMGVQQLAGRLSLKWVPDDTFNIVLRADVSADHDTGSTYHDLGYFTGTVLASGNKPSICNIPGTCTGFTDLLGHTIAPYYANYLTGTALNTAPAAYNALLNSVAREQTDGFWSTEQSLNNADIGHYHTISATADKLIGDIDVKLIGSYRGYDDHGSSNSRGLPYLTTTYLYQDPNYQSWQSELTITGNALDSRLKWTTGLFFFEESDPNSGGDEYLFLPSAVLASPVSGKQIAVTDWSNNGARNTSYAGYAQATYAVTDDTRITAGVRYTLDERAAYMDTQTIKTPSTAAISATVMNGVFNPASYNIEGISYAGQTVTCGITNAKGVVLPLSQCGSTVTANFQKPTWTFAVDHDLFDKTMIYATTRSGYRSGGIATTAASPAVTVAQPEDVMDFEVGIKSDWSLSGIPIRSNLDGYNTAYHNIQVEESLPNVTAATGPGGTVCTQTIYNAGQCTGTILQNVAINAKSGRVYGFEWDITAIPVPALTINFSGSYLDARYTNFSFAPPPGYLLQSGASLSGTPFPLPAWQTNVTASYALGRYAIGDVSTGDVVLTAHYYWQGRYLADLQSYNPEQQTSSYGRLNVQVSFSDFAASGTDLSFFANNVLDTKVCQPEYSGVLNSAPNATFGVAGNSGVLQCVPMAPRMLGLTLSHKID